MENSDNSINYPHALLYKSKFSKLSQEERRNQFLREQKEKKHQQVDKNRIIYDTFLKQIEESIDYDHQEDLIDDGEIEESNDATTSTTTHMEESIDAEETEEMEHEPVEVKKHKVLKYKLMHTEYFIDIPDDLEENWVFKLAPEGYHILLITRKYYTCFYNERGVFLLKIKSNLPGGGGTNGTGTTVLDCLYNKTAKTIFVLDCLFWNSMYTLDSDANFRFYWLMTKFKEMPELSKSVNLNYTFVLMDSLPVERSLVQDKMFDTLKVGEHEISYSGVVFYHKESQYIFGYTPVVTWLYSYMLPEKLGIDVPEICLKKTPKNYVNFQHFIDNKELFRYKRKKRMYKAGKGNESLDEMET